MKLFLRCTIGLLLAGSVSTYRWACTAAVAAPETFTGIRGMNVCGRTRTNRLILK